jgi:hypothetical protein
MSSRYIPPHMRNRKPVQEAKPAPKIGESDFPPTLVVGKPPKTFSGPSFLDKVREPSLTFPNPETNNRLAAHRNPMPVPYSNRIFEHDAEFSSDEEESSVQKPVTTEESEWTMVERKMKVKRDKIQEALDNGDAPIEDEEESAWDDQPEEHETYWDERRH